MRWLASQSRARVIAVAIAWPFLLLACFAAFVAWELHKARDDGIAGDTYVVFVGFEPLPSDLANSILTALIFLAPPALLVVLWIVARRCHPPAK